ncbi:MAG: hypothetical protein COA42_15275 [Alteromonadaceae bacterium]|nr:MAG: hypothetical protein COA42_15275 [Alteromonadaceae bacterium]
MTFNSDELNHAIAEAWIGYTLAFENGYRISYSLRGHTTEVKSGTGKRHILWGGLTLARNFNG